MRAIIVLITVMIIWVMTPALADAKDRDRHDRHYGKDRDHYAYKVDKHRDHDRHGKSWKQKNRHDKHDRYWGKHRKHKHAKQKHVIYRPYTKRVVYRPAPTRVVYREPVYYYPSSYLTIGVPNLNFQFTW